MKAEDLLELIGEADDKMIEDAGKSAKKKTPLWVKWGAMAACVCLAVAGLFIVLSRQNLIGAKAGGGGGEGITYMSYAGPVFPLSAERETCLTLARNIDFDFSPYKTFTSSYEIKGETKTYENYDRKSLVTDSYVLTNPSAQDETVTLYYPFAGSLYSRREELPKITADGESVETELHIGPYSGGFSTAYASGKDGPLLNLANLDSWEKYKALLGAGYQARAFDALPELTETVIVYELSDRYGERNEDGGFPDINVEFTIDYSKTFVMTYGFESGTNDIETGYCARGTHVPQPNNPDYGESAYLAVLGDDIGDYTVQGYTNGSHKTPYEDVGCTVTRYEMSFGDFMRMLAKRFRHAYGEEQDPADEEARLASLVSDEVYAGLAMELMYDYGILSESPVERFSDGMLEDIFSSTGSMGRVMYLGFEVTVPAGGTATVSAQMIKQASYDFVGSNLGRDGYDCVTKLGSCLSFTEQTASISNYEYINIIRQNFGFNLENGIDRVALSENEEHYFIEVGKKKDK